MTRPVRVSAKGVVVDEDRLLLNHLRHDRVGDFYELPGGGVRAGETLQQAVVREVREETGHSVDVRELLWVRDHIAAHSEHAYLNRPGFHQVEFIFRCSLAGPAVAEPHEADDYQMGVEWVEGSRLADVVFIPPEVVPRLEAFLADRTVGIPTYLGGGQLPSK